MSGTSRIPASLPTLLQRLGISDPALTFDLVGAVFPVSLVDTGISIPTTTLPPLVSSPASSGEAVWGVGSIPADTGPLPAGNYWVRFVWGSVAVAGSQRFGKRDAANAAYVWSQFAEPRLGTNTWLGEFSGFFTVAENERFRFEMIAALTTVGQGSIWAVRIS